MHSNGTIAAIQQEAAVCPCGTLFVPKRPWQRFCSRSCRSAYHTEHGHIGTVKGVRRLRRGISIVVHTDDDALLGLVPGQAVRIERA